MGNSLKKRGYQFELDQYSKLPLTSLSDDSDDEDDIYGHNVESGKIELQLIPPENGRSSHKLKPKPKIVKPDQKNKTIICWICCIFTTCIVIAAVGAIKWSGYNNVLNNGNHNSSIATSNKTHQKPALAHQKILNGSSENLSEINPQTSKQPTVSKDHPKIVHPKGKDWEKKFIDFGSESCIRLLDVDGDGILDVLFSAATSQDISGVLSNDEVPIKQMCKDKKLPYPCMGNMFALRGIDGEVIWKTYTRSAGIFMNCEDFDINQDGQKDCIISGRQSTIQAVDTKNGHMLWIGDENFLKKTWNIYRVLALPDFDGDGIPEVLISNGGDPSKDPKDHNRKSGRLIILSGATGKVVGTTYLAAPDKKEIYMSPVMYTTKDGSQYILFGSGGETIPGDFLIISLPDLYRYVNQLDSDAVVPGISGQYNQWQNYNRDKGTGLITIYRGKKKGVMVPPVIVDVNNDGTDDILVSSYDGHLILLNGEDLTTIWTAQFPDMESYSSPAPGYFNDDNVLDFMIHWSVGSWPTYSMTQTCIIDGKNGSKMFVMNSTGDQMSSDLSLHTSQQYRDMFIFKVRGRNSHIYFDEQHRIHGLNRTDKGPPPPEIQRFHHKHENYVPTGGNHGLLGNPPESPKYPLESPVNPPESPRSKRHEQTEEDQYLDDVPLENIFRDFSSRHFLCSDDIDFKSEMFLFDRTTADHPIKLTETVPALLNYTVPSHDGKGGDVEMCIVIMPMDRTTAAIGDVDGDGILDVVSVVGWMGEKIDSGYSYTESIFWTYIKKISLGPIIKDKGNRIFTDVQSTIVNNPKDKDISDIDILSIDQQKWTQYMGIKGNSHYTDKNKEM